MNDSIVFILITLAFIITVIGLHYLMIRAVEHTPINYVKVIGIGFCMLLFIPFIFLIPIGIYTISQIYKSRHGDKADKINARDEIQNQIKKNIREEISKKELLS